MMKKSLNYLTTVIQYITFILNYFTNKFKFYL